MATTYTIRTIPTTSWDNARLWWAYLVDINWDYILTSNSERIVIIVPWGDLPITDWEIRPII